MAKGAWGGFGKRFWVNLCILNHLELIKENSGARCDFLKLLFVRVLINTKD